MKKSPKYVLKTAVAERPAGGAARNVKAAVDEMHDEVGLALFAGIHASKRFTKQSAHRAFGGLSNKK